MKDKRNQDEVLLSRLQKELNFKVAEVKRLQDEVIELTLKLYGCKPPVKIDLSLKTETSA